ncbi:MAG: hypothetical protein K0Q71_5580 [Thermomicrobiales bacterium]|nr:hypothetical protein [Thermomicrobiales bacterium]
MATESSGKQPASRSVTKKASMAVTISGVSQLPSFSNSSARSASGPIIWLLVMENWW